MPENAANLENNINDLIGDPPGWLLRSGLAALAIVVVLVLGMAAFIRYPDKVTSIGYMTSSTPPIELKAKSSGLIDSIFVSNNERIKERDTLIYIKNTAIMLDMQRLLRFIMDLENSSDSPRSVFPTNLQVGDLQQPYAAMELAFADLQLFLSQTSPEKEANLIDSEIENLKSRRLILLRQEKLSKKELRLRKKDFDRSKTLYEERVISEADYEKAQTDYIQFEKQFETIRDGILRNKIEEEQLAQRLLSVQEDRIKGKNSRLFKLKELSSIIKIQLEEWQTKFFVMAELDGNVILNADMVVHRQLDPGKVVASVIPDEQNYADRFVSALVPASGNGKIEEGDEAIIKVEGYPYKEFGTINTTVSQLGIVPITAENGDQNYEVKLPLPEGPIVTQYGNEIPFKPSAPVSIDIITEDKSLLERVFNQFLNLINN